MDDSFEIGGLDRSFDLNPSAHECSICDYKSIYKSNLKRHMKVHVDSDDRGHEEQTDHHLCNDCGKTFKSRFGLKTSLQEYS